MYVLRAGNVDDDYLIVIYDRGTERNTDVWP